MTNTALSPRQQHVLDAIHRRPVQGIPAWLINPMEWRMIDRLAGVPEGTYRRDPIPTYRQMLVRCGCGLVDQWIPENPLSMGESGYEGETPRGATTGAHAVVVDGRPIREPEDVVAHLEEVVFPRLRQQAADYDPAPAVAKLLAHERDTQAALGSELLKGPYNCFAFPKLHYGGYGYGPYFMAVALYPETIERHFALQADIAVRHNQAVAEALVLHDLPPLVRLDHDMADSRGTLIDIRVLDRIWFPHFARSLAPALAAPVRLIWHCDGNLMAMVPRLLEVGLHGFQGFQYEDGMDYERICRMRTRTGDELTIIAGVSVTRTLPRGTPDDVRREMEWLVEHGPRQGLFLGGSSSITPGVPWENLRTFAEGLEYYRTHGR
jgi:hypothetical protein